MKTNKPKLIEFLKVNEIIILIEKENLKNNLLEKNLLISKLVEEMLEMAETFITKNIETIIEENYDVYNTAVSLFINHYGKIDLIYKIKLPDEKINTLTNTLNNARLLNSYLHIDTIFQSKTGLKSKKELESLLLMIINQSSNTIIKYINKDNKLLLSTTKMIEKKLNKWERKL